MKMPGIADRLRLDLTKAADWKDRIPIAVVAVSAFLLALGAWPLLKCQFFSVVCMEVDGLSQRTAVELCGLGLAGLLFLAMLKR